MRFINMLTQKNKHLNIILWADFVTSVILYDCPFICNEARSVWYNESHSKETVTKRISYRPKETNLD